MRRAKGPTRFGVIALTLMVAVLLGSCGRVPNGRVAETHHTLIAADGQRLEALETAIAERPVITEGTARARAAQAIIGAEEATDIQSRFVSLTLATDHVVRRVWLVTYLGVPFEPDGCTCHDNHATANTIVAIDGQTGEVVLIFGDGDGWNTSSVAGGWWSLVALRR